MWLCIAAINALAVEPGAPAESQVVEPHQPPPGGFTFLGLVQARATASNLASTNPFLDGQVVGRLGGTNGVIADPSVLSAVTEERVGGFFTYRPTVLNGNAELAAAFEVDFAFGDRSYGTGGNTGGAFGGDMVNLQTRRLYAGFRPKYGAHSLHVMAGLQFVGDSVTDPTAGGPDGLLRSGGRLMVLGSEASGLSVYGRMHDDWGDRVRWRAGAFTLYEQGMAEPDDLTLFVGDVAYIPAYATQVGLHAWYLQDRTGGAVGSLGAGPTSALSELQGGPRLDPYDGAAWPEDAQIYADIAWLGADASYNADLTADKVGASGVVLANVGRIYAPVVQDYAVRGLLADGEVRYRYAPGEGSVVRGEVLFTSGDDPDRGAYTGVITANSWGVAGAVPATHGSLLLMSDPRSVNRMVAVVSDVSGAGRGVRMASVEAGYDPIPGRLTLAGGVASATTADGEGWGTEIHGKVVAEPLLLCNIGWYVGYVIPGTASGLTSSPWETYVSLDWVVF